MLKVIAWKNFSFYWKKKKKLTNFVIERNCGMPSYIAPHDSLFARWIGLSEVHASEADVPPSVRLEEPANYGSVHSVCIVYATAKQMQFQRPYRERGERNEGSYTRKQEDITSHVIGLRVFPEDRGRDIDLAFSFCVVSRVHRAALTLSLIMPSNDEYACNSIVHRSRFSGLYETHRLRKISWMNV